MKIFINGKEQEVRALGLDELKHERGIAQDCVILLNGYQTEEDLPLHPGDQVVQIPKGIMPGREEMEVLMSARNTPSVYERLKKARVAVAGLGGLGSHIAVSLARAGVGALLLVDFDRVEPSNLNRQHYDMRHLGMYKTDALAEQLRRIHPFLKLETQNVRVTQDNAARLFSEWPIVCEAFDRPENKAMLTETLLTQLPEIRLVAASGMAGFESGNRIQTCRRMKNLYLCGDLETESKPGQGLMAPRVMICAGHQANMVLRLILGEDEP